MDELAVKRLAAAILEDAIKNLHLKDSRDWIWEMGCYMKDYPFSFKNICSALSLNPTEIRHTLLKLPGEWKQAVEDAYTNN